MSKLVVDQLRIILPSSLLAALLLLPALAVGTVQEQRARLPEPKECADPAQGVWKSHTFSAVHGQWTEFKLYIRRKPGEAETLIGRIENHSWEGDPDHPQPGPCESLSGVRYQVSMDAEGTLRGRDVAFWGIDSWRLDKEICGSFTYGYNLDKFTGTIDPEIQEFQSVNNDGGMAVNEPTVFRRIECFDEEVDPMAEVTPPPFTPPRLGCGSW